MGSWGQARRSRHIRPGPSHMRRPADEGGWPRRDAGEAQHMLWTGAPGVRQCRTALLGPCAAGIRMLPGLLAPCQSSTRAHPHLERVFPIHLHPGLALRLQLRAREVFCGRKGEGERTRGPLASSPCAARFGAGCCSFHLHGDPFPHESASTTPLHPARHGPVHSCAVQHAKRLAFCHVRHGRQLRVVWHVSRIHEQLRGRKRASGKEERRTTPPLVPHT
jgi:hypothetical protein